ncbi:MAG: hypothetical protein ACI9G1_002533 [Pirellulaceae bacterium]
MFDAFLRRNFAERKATLRLLHASYKNWQPLCEIA